MVLVLVVVVGSLRGVVLAGISSGTNLGMEDPRTAIEV